MFSTKNGLYERARKKLKIQDGMKLFTYSFYKQRKADVQVGSSCLKRQLTWPTRSWPASSGWAGGVERGLPTLLRCAELRTYACAACPLARCLPAAASPSGCPASRKALRVPFRQPSAGRPAQGKCPNIPPPHALCVHAPPLPCLPCLPCWLPARPSLPRSTPRRSPPARRPATTR